jgi:hypothetical protein
MSRQAYSFTSKPKVITAIIELRINITDYQLNNTAKSRQLWPYTWKRAFLKWDGYYQVHIYSGHHITDFCRAISIKPFQNLACFQRRIDLDRVR